MAPLFLTSESFATLALWKKNGLMDFFSMVAVLLICLKHNLLLFCLSYVSSSFPNHFPNTEGRISHSYHESTRIFCIVRLN